MLVKNRFFSLLIVISTIILLNSEIAAAVENTQIIIGENLKPGMTLKDAMQLLGTPDTITVSKNGTVLMPYNTLGLSIEAMSGGTTIEAIHVQPAFKGQFASGIEIGTDFQKILSVYNQPDIKTKEIIEYSGPTRIFKIQQGKLTGADFYSMNSTLYSQVTGKKTGKSAVNDAAEKEKIRNELREEVRNELRQEVREEVIKEMDENIDVFDLYGFKVRQGYDKVIVTEIRPGSVAEAGGLKVKEAIRKVFYGRDRSSLRNIYGVSGLIAILKRAINKHKENIYILQNGNRYCKVEVPKIK